METTASEEKSEDTSQDKDQGQPAPQAQLGKTLLAGLRLLWDRLGLLLAISITWTLLLSLPLTVERWLPRGAPLVFHYGLLLLLPVIATLPTAGAFAVVHRIATHDEAFYLHLWQEGAALFGPALRLSLIQTGVSAILLMAAWFYLRIPHWSGRLALLVSGYTMLVWLMMALYHWPVLIAQEKGVFDDPDRRARRGAIGAIRRSFFLAMGRPFYTLGLFAVVLALSVVMGATLVLGPVLWIGTMAVLTTVATRALLMQYGIVPAPIQEAAVPDEQFRLK